MTRKGDMLSVDMFQVCLHLKQYSVKEKSGRSEFFTVKNRL
jgi:hypothetical protein